MSLPAISQDADTAGRAKVRFCYQDSELYPNYTGTGSAKPSILPGVNIELYDLVAKKAGAQVSYSRFSWNRCVALLTAGRVDSLIASFNPERVRFAAFPMINGQPDPEKRITTSGYYLYHLGNRPLWDGTKFVDPSITVAAPLGYSIVRDLMDRNINVVEAGTTAGLLKLLRVGRFDAIAVPGSTADTIIRNDITQFAMIVKDPAPLRKSPYFIVFSKAFAAGNRALVEAFWNTVPDVRTRFRDQIIAKY